MRASTTTSPASPSRCQISRRRWPTTRRASRPASTACSPTRSSGPRTLVTPATRTPPSTRSTRPGCSTRCSARLPPARCLRRTRSRKRTRSAARSGRSGRSGSCCSPGRAGGLGACLWLEHSSMAIVETKQIRKVFADHTAVDGVDLSVREGEFLVLLGPSGCGKTTLLRMIAGLEKQTSGDVVIGGTVVNDLPPRERKIAMVFQSYALYPHMTVAKNIAFPLKAAGIPKDQIEGRVQKAASMFGIERLLHRKPRQLSGGERQRVALARAMVREPSVFLLDEPLSN